jgi:hypothetical protein
MAARRPRATIAAIDRIHDQQVGKRVPAAANNAPQVDQSRQDPSRQNAAGEIYFD